MDKIRDYCSYACFNFDGNPKYFCTLNKTKCNSCNNCIKYMDETYINNMNKYDVEFVRMVKLMKINKNMSKEEFINLEDNDIIIWNEPYYQHFIVGKKYYVDYKIIDCEFIHIKDNIGDDNLIYYYYDDVITLKKYELMHRQDKINKLYDSK